MPMFAGYVRTDKHTVLSIPYTSGFIKADAHVSAWGGIQTQHAKIECSEVEFSKWSNSWVA